MKRKSYLNIFNCLNLVVILICTLFFQGCSTDRKNEVNKSSTSQRGGEIAEAKLTDREKELLQGLDIERYFIFDANIKDKNISSLDMWVDYYEKGSFKNKCCDIGTDIQASQDKNIKIIFSTQKYIANNCEEKWTSAICSNGSSGKGSFIIKPSEKIQGSTWSSIKRSEIIIGKEVFLAAIVGTEGGSLSSISMDSLSENDETIKNKSIEELLQNDYVYILKCKFK